MCVSAGRRKAKKNQYFQRAGVAGVASVAVAGAAVAGVVAAAIASSKMPIVVVGWRGLETFC